MPPCALTGAECPACPGPAMERAARVARARRGYDACMRCSTCRVEKPAEQFPTRGNNTPSNRCFECQRAYMRDWYRANKDRHIAAARRYSAKNGAALLAAVAAFKSKPCADCGQTFPLCVMECDHVRGTKRANVANMVGGGRCRYSLAAVLAELAKCDVVCANCHRIRTHERRTRLRERGTREELHL